MAVNPIPDKLKSFRVYQDGSTDLLGVADVTLPKLEFMKENITGSGIAGEVEMPVAGHVGPMSLSLKWRVVTPNLIRLATPEAQNLALYGAIQFFDAGLGQILTRECRLSVRAMPKNVNLGKLEQGKMMDSETELEILSLRLYLDKVERLHVDKFNFIFAVDGLDWLAAERQALGLE
ncbi:MAG: phage major tail tube protein [Thermodesulfobacteriota bacterium]